MTKTQKTLLMLAGAALVAGACGSLGPDDIERAKLEANRARWESVGPRSYVYSIQLVCFCPPDYAGPVRIWVVDGVAVERVYVDSGAEVPEEVAEEFPTVDGLFEVLRDAFESDAHEIRVTYDPELGVPIDFWIDYIEMAVDEELGIQVTEDVTPLPQALASAS